MTGEQSMIERKGRLNLLSPAAGDRSYIFSVAPGMHMLAGG